MAAAEPQPFDEEGFRSFFQKLFFAFFGRAPDEEAISAFMERSKRGLPAGQIVEELAASVEYAEKLRHRMFVQPGHYYSAIAHADEAAAAIAKIDKDPIPHTLPGILIDRQAMLNIWSDLLAHMMEPPFPSAETHGFRYHFDNPNFAFGDSLILQAMLRHFRPPRVVEVGSGFSSACMMDVNDLFLNGTMEITFIEPFPELLHKLVDGTSGKVDIRAIPIQRADLSIFKSLKAGDFLFIDSTHVLRTGSDVNVELFEVLPEVAPGVMVHIHDIFWPFEYPREWVIDENRSWNELYAVRAFLTQNREWEIVMFNNYIARTAADQVPAPISQFLRNPGAGLYLRKKSLEGSAAA